MNHSGGFSPFSKGLFGAKAAVFFSILSRHGSAKHQATKFRSINHRWNHAFALTLLAFMVISVSHLHGQDMPNTSTDTNGVAIYKKMSLEQLMNQDVTSVSKVSEPYSQAPAALDVITGGEIRRSGASSIPVALRLAWHPTKRLKLSIVGQNLLHDHHAEYGFPTPGREEIECGAYGKVAWRF